MKNTHVVWEATVNEQPPLEMPSEKVMSVHSVHTCCACLGAGDTRWYVPHDQGLRRVKLC